MGVDLLYQARFLQDHIASGTDVGTSQVKGQTHNAAAKNRTDDPGKDPFPDIQEGIDCAVFRAGGEYLSEADP